MQEPIIRQSRKSGGSIIISLTDFIEPNKYYVISKEDGSVILKEAEIKVK